MIGLKVDDKMIESPFKWRWCLDPAHAHSVRFSKSLILAKSGKNENAGRGQ